MKAVEKAQSLFRSKIVWVGIGAALLVYWLMRRREQAAGRDLNIKAPSIKTEGGFFPALAPVPPSVGQKGSDGAPTSNVGELTAKISRARL